MGEKKKSLTAESILNSGLKIQHFLDLAKEHGEKAIIRTIYKSFINNSQFEKIESNDEKIARLANLKKIIKEAIEITSKEQNKSIAKTSRVQGNKLFGYQKTLQNTIDHIEKKLNETYKGQQYNNFRVKGNITKVIFKFVETISVSKAINSDETESLSRGDVESIVDQLSAFLENVEKNINEIIQYSPLLKIKNNLKNLINIDTKFTFEEFEKRITNNDDNFEKIIKNIKSIAKEWKTEGYSEICKQFMTLNTEKSSTKRLREIVKKVGKNLWIGAAILAFVGIKTKML